MSRLRALQASQPARGFKRLPAGLALHSFVQPAAGTAACVPCPSRQPPAGRSPLPVAATAAAAAAMSRLLALPPDLLEAVMALVPEQGCGEEEDECGFSCEGSGFHLWVSSRPLEATCRRLRSTALALPPARLALHFDEDQAAAGIDMQSLLRCLRRRPPALHLEIADMPAGIPPAAWEQLAPPLLSGTRQLFVRGGNLDPLLEGARCFMRLQSLTVWPSDCISSNSVAPLPNPAALGCAWGGQACRRSRMLASLLHALSCMPCCAAWATPVPSAACRRALTTLTSVDLDCEQLPAELAASLASLPQLQTVRLHAWEPLAALGSSLHSLRFVLGDASGKDEVPAVLPRGLLALTAVDSISLDVYPGWDEQQPGLPGLDRLPGADSVTLWHTFNPPEVWRCSTLHSLEFNNASAAPASMAAACRRHFAACRACRR